ncbi:MAG TPA: Na+/H+ antiporter NhaA [Caulobacteraceae bacterium]
MARRLTLDFLKTESGAGLLLALAAAAAVAWANSPWADRYFALVATPIAVRLGDFAQTRSLSGWVADGLMAIFFLVVGMEIKFEVLRGELSSPRRLALPVLAALGGMVVPALVYMAVNLGPRGVPSGWPAATATDIAFALAALAIVAPRLPSALRVFLLTLAIADDVGAVALIALLYTAKLDPAATAGVGLALAALAALSRWRRAPFLFYAVGFVVVWGFTLQSGLNTSIAGIACAMTVPVGARRAGQDSVLKFFMDSLHPYVAYAILPLFAFTAAGFSLGGLGAREILSPVPLGLALALLIGKPVGVFGFSLAATATRVARKPAGGTWLELFGVSLVCGVGFTVSLFIGGLAFHGAGRLGQDQLRLGVIAGSLLATLTGAAVLARAQALRAARPEDPRQ